MKKKHASVNHPLWDKLRSLNKEATRRFPEATTHHEGFGALGLILHNELENWEYWCDAKNALAFASTGGEGVHFSFIMQGGKVTEKSPIVITIPEAFDRPNLIGGESLFDFLCLGYHRGYFALEQLPMDKCFKAYGSAEWQPKEDSDWYFGYGVNEHQRKLLDFLIGELGLSPWKDLKRKFQRLQKIYMPLLDSPRTVEDF